MEDVFGVIADSLASIAAATDLDAVALDILDSWAAWGAAIRKPEGNPEADAAYEHAANRRDELLDAAEALPATLDSLLAKALAISWLEFVSEERPKVPRSGQSFTGRIALDIHTAIMGRAA